MQKETAEKTERSYKLMTRDDLRGIIEGITDEQLKKILDIHSADIGKAKGDVESIKTELENANKKIGEYETEIGNLKESLGDAKELQKKFDDLQADIDARKKADEAAAAENALKARFDTACGESKFLNDFTRAGLYSEFKTALSDEANAGKSDKDIYEAITNGKENIFMPEDGLPGVAAGSSGGGTAATDAEVREIMGLPPLEK